MHAPVAIVAVLIAAVVFSHRTFRLSPSCGKEVAGCSMFKAAKGVDAEFIYSGFSVRHGYLVADLVCAIRNSSDSIRTMDLSNIELLSAEVKMERRSIKKANTAEPGLYTIDPGTEEDVSFAFRSVDRFSKRNAGKKMKAMTFYFVQRQASRVDTLVRLTLTKKGLRH